MSTSELNVKVILVPLNQPRWVLWCSAGSEAAGISISGMHWDGIAGSLYVYRAAEGEANTSSVTLLGWFVKTWGSILTLPWPATLLLTGHLSQPCRAGPTSLIPSSHQAATPAGLCHHVPPPRWKKLPKQGPQMPCSQVLLIRTLATNGLSLPLAVTLICLAQPDWEVRATKGAACPPLCLGDAW